MIKNKKICFLNEIKSMDIPHFGISLHIISNLIQENLVKNKGFCVNDEFIIDIYETTGLNLDEYFLSKNWQTRIVIPEITKSEILSHYGHLSGFTDVPVDIKIILFDKKNITKNNVVVSSKFNIKGAENLLESLIQAYFDYLLLNKNNFSNVLNGNHSIVAFINKSYISEVSGCATLHDGDNELLEIEAVFGNFEQAKINGIVPDIYLIDILNKSIQTKNISNQEFLFLENNEKVKISSVWQNRQKIEDKQIQDLISIYDYILANFELRPIIYWQLAGNDIYVNWLLIENNLNVDNIDNSFQKEKTSHFNQSTKIDSNNITTESIDNVHEELTTKSMIDMPSNYSLFIEGSYYKGHQSYGNVSFINSEINSESILVLRGDEDISADLVVKGFVIEDPSDVLAIELNKIFNVPVITGVKSATKIFKEGENIYIDGTSGRIYVQSMHENLNFKTNANTDYIASEPIVYFNQLINSNEEKESNYASNQVLIENENDNKESFKKNYHNNAQINSNTTLSKDINVINDDLDEEKTNSKNNIIYEDSKITIERKNQPVLNVIPDIRNTNTELSKLLELINDDFDFYKIKDENNSNHIEIINPVNQDNQYLSKQLENIINSSKEIRVDKAINILEESNREINEILTTSKELDFDKAENYINQKSNEVAKQEIKKQKNVTKKSNYIKNKEEYIPTVTKVYLSLIDDVVEDDLLNYDGIIFSFTQEPELGIELLLNNLSKVNDKPVLLNCPPYEKNTLKIFFEEIAKIRNLGYRNLSLILPDYRNKNDIIDFKNILSALNLRRSSTFELYANLSRGINVFRMDELDTVLIDGVYVDLFRLKMNLLGIESMTASTRYVKGMVNLNNYINEKLEPDLKCILNISGFKNKKKIINNLINLDKVKIISCEKQFVNKIKKLIKASEESMLLSNQKLRSKKLNFI